MRRMIALSDLVGMPTPKHDQYSAPLMNEARNALVKTGLRYDNKTGIVYKDGRWVERFSNPSDHVPTNNEEEVMQWIFRRFIANGASRISRGYPAT